MRWLNTVLGLYAAIMILIGVQAWFSTRSVPSIAGGATIGLLILGSIALSFTNPRPARIGAAVICLLVLGWFGSSYARTQDFYPAGFIAILTFIALGCLVAGHFMGMLARRERGRETLPAEFAETQARAREESKVPPTEPKA